MKCSPKSGRSQTSVRCGGSGSTRKRIRRLWRQVRQTCHRHHGWRRESGRPRGPAIAVLSARGYCYSPYRPDVRALVLQAFAGFQDTPFTSRSVWQHGVERPPRVSRLPESASKRRVGVRMAQDRSRCALSTRSRSLHGCKGSVRCTDLTRIARLKPDTTVRRF